MATCIYRVNRRTEQYISWRCTIPDCPAYIYTENNIPAGFVRQQHTHQPDNAEIEARQIMDSGKNRSSIEVRAVPSVYVEELNKRKTAPPLPKTPADIDLSGKWTQTSADSRTQRDHRHLPRDHYQKLLLPLYGVYVEKGASHRTSDSLQREGRRLPLAPLDDFRFQALEDRDEADLTNLTERFTSYVTEHWVEGERLVWNHLGTQGPRTTNNLEGFHCKLKKIDQHAHLNIYSTVQTFKDLQNANKINRIQRAAGGTTRPKSKKYLTIDLRLTTLKDLYQDGLIRVMVYTDSKSQLIHLG